MMKLPYDTCQNNTITLEESCALFGSFPIFLTLIFDENNFHEVTCLLLHSI